MVWYLYGMDWYGIWYGTVWHAKAHVSWMHTFGFLTRTRALPQASDCSVLLNSPSSAGHKKTTDYLCNSANSLFKTKGLTYPCSLFDFIKAKSLSFIEHQQHQGLKQWYLELFFLLKQKPEHALNALARETYSEQPALLFFVLSFMMVKQPEWCFRFFTLYFVV